MHKEAADGIDPCDFPIDVAGLIHDLTAIRSAMVNFENDREAAFRNLDDTHRQSARNLLHYLALRQHDIRHLQRRLAKLGLSSLGRTEAHVLASVNAVLGMLNLLKADRLPDLFLCEALDFIQGNETLRINTQDLLGPSPARRNTRIMVTMPSEAATNPSYIPELMASGMDCMRINCAHDNAEAWAKMIENLRQAEKTRRRKCKLLMDLSGPKLRTGPIAGPIVMKCRPDRDYMGRVIAPVRVAFVAQGAGYCPKGATVIPVPADWLEKLALGDHVVFTDARSARRSVTVTAQGEKCVWAESRQTFYISEGTVLQRRSGTSKAADGICKAGPVDGDAPSISLQNGDTLVMTASTEPGQCATYSVHGQIITPATIGCTLPEVFAQVRAGEHIWLDDGKIGGVIKSAEAQRLIIEITELRSRKEKLFADKGINLPASSLNIPALTETDLKDLEFVAKHADIVGMSFVNCADDVVRLQGRLSDLNAAHLGVILKIETRRAFEQLPEILLAAMPCRSAGVMIARGDLAVECGFERLAEVQEEILWICEAAHVPVIWATQVLETLAKTGFPTRAEITDAAMAVRAECVMLNKGSHITDAIATLDDILKRMEAHQDKKVSLLRPLRSWRNPAQHIPVAGSARV